MTLLAFESVACGTALDDVSFDVDVGEFVIVHGRRKSGKTLLLRLAAGLTRPDRGAVTFAGRGLDSQRPLGTAIGWAHSGFGPGQGRTMDQRVGFPLLTEASQRAARSAGAGGLERVGLADIAGMRPEDCQPRELLLAGIARALVTGPRLLLLDEPLLDVSDGTRDEVRRLLRRHVADGLAVLMTADSVLLGAGRHLILSCGSVRGETTPKDAPVMQLRKASA